MKRLLLLFFIFLIESLFAGSTQEPIFYNLSEACQLFPSSQRPPAENDGRIQTLNQKGAVSPGVDLAQKAWLDAIQPGDQVLDIGGAYGRDTISALKKGAICHLLDVEPRHLGIAARMIESLIERGELSPDVRNRIFFIEADISKPLKFFPTQYKHVLVARVLHFFGPPQIQTAMTNIEQITMEDGYVYVIAITPYVERFKKFIDEFEKNKANGDPFPGYVGGLLPWVNRDVTTAQQIKNLHQGPFMFLDRDGLSGFLGRAFKVLYCEHHALTYPSESWERKANPEKNGGQENVIAIARKKPEKPASQL